MKKKLYEDYYHTPSKWFMEMSLLVEEDTYNITVQTDIELPFPMQDGKNKLEAGDYEVELSPDKANYIWTNPDTQERVVFPIELINQPTEEQPAPGEEPLPGADIGTQEINPLVPPEQSMQVPEQPLV
jgi:hypothetical protein